MATDQLIVPLAPSAIEVDRLGATLTLAAEAEDLGASLEFRLLLTRVRSGTRSASDVRASLAGLELPMLAAEIRLLERYSQAHGQPAPENLGDYSDVLAELIAAGVPA